MKNVINLIQKKMLLEQAFTRIHLSNFNIVEIESFFEKVITNISESKNFNSYQFERLCYYYDCLVYLEQLLRLNIDFGFSKNKEKLKILNEKLLELEYSLFYENNKLFQKLLFYKNYIKDKENLNAVNYFLNNLGQNKKDSKLFYLKDEIRNISNLLNKNLIDFVKDKKNWIKINKNKMIDFYKLPSNFIQTAKEKSLILQDEINLYFEPTEYNLQILLSNCKDQKLRKRLYNKYMSTNTNGKYNNEILLKTILTKKQQLANIKKSSNYFELMNKNNILKENSINNFFDNLIEYIEPIYNDKLKKMGISQELSWDWRFLEKNYYMKNEDNQEDKNIYYSSDFIVKNVMTLIEKEFFVKINKISNLFGNKLLCFEVFDKITNKKAFLYIDLYTRETKNDGVNFSENLVSHNKQGVCQNLLTLNFKKENTFYSALILAHEMGHFLKDFFSQNKKSVTTSQNISNDLIELPSQYLEKLLVYKYSYLFNIDTEQAKSYIAENKVISFYKNLLINKDKMNLFIKFNRNKKELKEFFNLKNNGFNIYNDYFMFCNSDFLDYGVNSYVYAFCDLLAFSILNKNKKNNIYYSRYLFSKFNTKSLEDTNKNLYRITTLNKNDLNNYFI